MLASAAYLLGLKYFCYRINKLSMLSASIILIAINLFYFLKLQNGRRIVKEKPFINDSKKLSEMIAVLYFIITIVMSFLGPLYGKVLWEQCK
jgi:hypothetical protein